MSNVQVDGFGTYGTGTNSTAVHQALLAGVYADMLVFTSVSIARGLPWDAGDPNFWAHCDTVVGASAISLRRVLPAAQTTIIVSAHIAVPDLPTVNSDLGIIDFRNVANVVRGKLYIDTTGALRYGADGGTDAVTTGPVIVAEKVHHLEMKLNRSTKALKVKIDEVTVLDVTLTSSTTDDIAQYAICGRSIGDGTAVYITDVIVRDTSGTYNKDFVGDRRVATLLPNADDLAHQGWTPEPLHRFGNGILDLTATNSFVKGPASVATNIGASDFTIEGQYRLLSLPTGGNKAVLFGKWDGTSGNLRSYQLYLGGPSLDSGQLVFRTSTNGQNGTVVRKLIWPWVPDLGHWYHVAVSRVAGVLRLFIDGVQAGIDVADSDTYFASTARPAIGIEVNGTSIVASTDWKGWQDAFRLTIGAGRYTTNFTPPAAAFPRNGSDPDWADVIWLSDWDNSATADDGPLGLALTGSPTITPNDGDGAYQTINKATPSENTFIEAALIAASGTFTLTAVPTATETVTVGTTDGSTPAVYTFRAALASAYDVLIGASATASVANLVAAINKGAGEGTTYGTGTVVNNDVAATALPTAGQMSATALVSGTVGNAIASTETCANGSWGHATLQGGQDIPGESMFYFTPLPPGATIVDSVTFAGRQYKTDAGTATTVTSLVGAGGAESTGGDYSPGTAPNIRFDTFEEDPDSSDIMTPQMVRTMRVKIDRTA